MPMTHLTDTTARSPQQERSRVTTAKFVAAAMKLLEKQTFAELSVNELAVTAKRSVGVFYQRFGSKDAFLKILLSSFLETGVGPEAALKWQGKTPAEIFSKFLMDTHARILAHRNLWHAALELSSSDPTFWGQYGGLRARRFDDLVGAMEKSRGKKLSPAEIRRFAVASQLFNSVINNQIINSPGPLTLDDNEFLPTMTEIALNVAGLKK
ncbi:MAG: TetR/AcrR family transcriptional regulator [Parvularculaceae bacterium]